LVCGPQVVREQLLGGTQTIFRPKISHTHKNIHFNCAVHKSNYVERKRLGTPYIKDTISIKYLLFVAQIPMTYIGLLTMQCKSQ
jgi:hypothetical protein